MRKVVTENFQETREEGKKLAQNLRGGEVVCLEGELGAGKTTFTQGILEELSAEKPYTSPTFVIMKKYSLTPQPPLPKGEDGPLRRSSGKANQEPGEGEIKTAYHIDTYRVDSDDILDLGFEEIVSDKNNVVIIEWPERIKKIIPQKAKWISFKWIGKDEREIAFKK